MDQQKVGQFLKELRSKKSLTQEQLAGMLGVSNRSISRWENGVTMPDFDMLIQMAKFYDVEIEEILNGERKGENMDKQTEETLLKIADYNNAEKEFFTKRLHYVCIVGLVMGALLTGAIYTSRHMSKIRAAKMRLLKHDK